MSEKPINWIGSSLEDLSAFPESVRRKAGFQLRLVQRGDEALDVKPMSSVGIGVKEIRIHSEDAYRVFYVAKFEEAVYVLHAFQKKSQKTSKLDIATGQRRYQQMLEYRKAKE